MLMKPKAVSHIVGPFSRRDAKLSSNANPSSVLVVSVKEEMIHGAAMEECSASLQQVLAKAVEGSQRSKVMYQKCMPGAYSTAP
eukprot:CAMPEP_0177204266 /NCGR_PEP_ID=MMETSP0367-20130122/28250_1 /TAXON_ID=447022 ORGANISM="Scrippsiella hangoei-like, Strain SHHI-4" /NCGR_SAMPLE_ID=MMETSP0367 /ASSEMBLY_ACC=CAM_ASM_000362 /LENGTH=83 /DNA_ID=CAMNT_0018652939 /DNA_START=265 /DNA_END=516 /DNA_ORIENTATION=+